MSNPEQPPPPPEEGPGQPSVEAAPPASPEPQPQPSFTDAAKQALSDEKRALAELAHLNAKGAAQAYRDAFTYQVQNGEPPKQA